MWRGGGWVAGGGGVCSSPLAQASRLPPAGESPAAVPPTPHPVPGGRRSPEGSALLLSFPAPAGSWLAPDPAEGGSPGESPAAEGSSLAGPAGRGWASWAKAHRQGQEVLLPGVPPKQLNPPNPWPAHGNPCWRGPWVPWSPWAEGLG